MTKTNKTALVTGSAGFIGRHVVADLERQGYIVGQIDIKKGPSHENDCRWLFNQRVNGYDTTWDLVVHCAAVVGGRETISNDPLAVAVDLSIDADFFRWAVRTKQPRVVYWSSCAAYPVHLQIPERRSYEFDLDVTRTAVATGRWDAPALVGVPDLTYGWAKVTGEMLAGFARQEGVNVHILRPFSGYGEDQDPTYPFPAFIDRALRREDPFEVWGDGTQVRDFIHVDDIIGMMNAVIDQDVQVPVNIGSGIPTNFLDLAKLVAVLADNRLMMDPLNCDEPYHPEIVTRPDKPTGPAYRVADTTLMRTIYEPKVDLEQGIVRALRARSV